MKRKKRGRRGRRGKKKSQNTSIRGWWVEHDYHNVVTTPVTPIVVEQPVLLCNDVWYHIVEFMSWKHLLKLSSISSFHNTIMQKEAELRFEKAITEGLPQVCVGRRMMEGEEDDNMVIRYVQGHAHSQDKDGGPTYCAHIQKHLVCKSVPFIPSFKHLRFGELPYLKKCSKTNAIQKPAKLVSYINLGFPGENYHRQKILTPVNDNPSWLCSVKLVQKRDDETFYSCFKRSVWNVCERRLAKTPLLKVKIQRWIRCIIT
ncbi:MAG: hypothetical protein ACTSUE_04155 [Promethearchaeota archaeon]